MVKKTSGRKNEVRSIGLDVSPPDKTCEDRNCPFCSGLAVKQETKKGVVVKKDVSGSATIEWERQRVVPKYERYERRRSRLRVHNPGCLSAKVGDEVLVARTRPISKTKNFVIVSILNKG